MDNKYCGVKCSDVQRDENNILGCETCSLGKACNPGRLGLMKRARFNISVDNVSRSDEMPRQESEKYVLEIEHNISGLDCTLVALTEVKYS